MSSAILYLAIIAIWLGVLVPRWLRRPAAVAVRTAEARTAEAPGRAHANPLWPDTDSDTEPIPLVTPEHDHLVSRGPSPAARRRTVLRARRRLLFMITALTSVALGMALTHVAAWWVVIPPSMMFGGFTVLLREAARVDADRASRLAAQARRSQAVRQGAKGVEAGGLAREAVVEGAREAARAPVTEPEPARTAEIIDISARLGDQLYDQYADAAVRAVGD